MSSSTPSEAEAWVPIARILRAQGRLGEVLAETLGDAEALFAAGREIWLSADDAAPQPGAPPLIIERSWRPTGRNAGRVVLKLRGSDTISDAEALARRYALIPLRTLPRPEDGAFYVRELIGCALFDTSTPDRPLGVIEGVEYPVTSDGRRLEAAPDLLAVRIAGVEGGRDFADPLLIPFVQAWLVEADLAARRLVLRLPEGLLDAQREALDTDAQSEALAAEPAEALE